MALSTDTALATGQDSTPKPPATLPTASIPWWGRIETLWLMLVPVGILAYVLAQPLSPNDLWYHVRAGEIIARLGRIPSENSMSLGVPLDTPYFYQSWLAELTLYFTLEKFGLSGLQILRAVCFTGGFALVVAACFRAVLRAQTPPNLLMASRLTAVCSVCALLLAFNNLDLRPQSFSVLLFGIFIFALSEWRHTKGLIWAGLTALTVWVWANTHGAFIIGPFLLFIFACCALFTSEKPFARSYWLLAVGSLLLICLNPNGLDLFAYVARLSTNTIGQQYIQEWQSPAINDFNGALFYLSGIVLLGIGLKTRFVNPAWWAAAALLFVMGARDARSVIWFALWLPVVVAPSLAASLPLKSSPNVPISRPTILINGFIIGLLWLVPVALLPNVKPLIDWPATYRQKFAPTPQNIFPGAPPLLLDRQTAVEPVEFLRKNPPRGRIFTDMLSGSYMTWATYPTLQPWCDPRIELFPVAFWERYLHLSKGPENAADELRKNFSAALIDKTTQPQLFKRLSQSPHWRRVSSGGPNVLFKTRHD